MSVAEMELDAKRFWTYAHAQRRAYQPFYLAAYKGLLLLSVRTRWPLLRSRVNAALDEPPQPINVEDI